jgi:hypothetical protein
MYGPDKLEGNALTPDSLQRLIDHHRDVAQHHQEQYDHIVVLYPAELAPPHGIVDNRVTARLPFVLFARKRPGDAGMAEEALKNAAIHRETSEALEALQSKLRAEAEALLIAADEADEA